MACFDTGVSGYIVARATVEVRFPIDWRGSIEIACRHCPFLHRTSGRCGLNQAIVNFPDKYVGEDCPLEEVKPDEVQRFE